jgi:hypothetical protein
VTTEDKFVYITAAFCVILLTVGTLIAKKLSTAPPRVIRTVWPVVAILTGVGFATLVYIARTNVKG